MNRWFSKTCLGIGGDDKLHLKFITYRDKLTDLHIGVLCTGTASVLHTSH